MESNNIYQGFEPIIFENSQVLILGSFPSVKSRENNFYYANPQNRFWKMIANFFNENLPFSINEKIEFCRKHKIALWDVVEQSCITGSSDNQLSKTIIKFSDIDSLLKKYSNISKILCNGSLSYNLLIKNFKINLPIEKMPSTSPANVRFKIDEWEKSLNFLINS